jgi:hypothetical protein
METKTKAWKKFVADSTAWGNPYKIINNIVQKLEFPALKVNSTNLVTEKEKYEHLINEFFPVVNDRLPNLTDDIALEGDDDLLDKIVRELKNKKANGADRISNKMIKIFQWTNKSNLKIMYNKCLELVYFPKIWKKGKIKVLNKPGKIPNNAKAYYYPY